jgi:hypothetical protein
MLGNQRPRLSWSPPRSTSAGDEAIELAASAGLYLDEWEQWVLRESLGERQDGRWAAFEVGLIVSRQNGKGSILEARELAGLFLFGEQLLVHTAHEFKTATEAFRRIRRLIERTPSLDRMVARIPESHGEEGIELRTGQRLRFLARTGSSGRGFTCDLLVYDEAMILEAEDVGASLPTLSARSMSTEAGPQVWYTGSAGIGRQSTQLAAIRARGKAGCDDPAAGDPSLCFAEWSIDPHDEYCPSSCRAHDNVSDPASWARANPGLGIRISLEHIAREQRGMPAKQFLCERLGVGDYPMPKDAWGVISRAWWEACSLPYHERDDPPRPGKVAFAVDTAPDRAATSVGLAGVRDDGRAQVELADHQAGTSWVVGRAVQLDRAWHPVSWVIDPASAARTFIEPLEKAGLRVWQPNAREVGAAFGDFYDTVRDRNLLHADDEDFDHALAGATTRRLSDQKAWDRTHSLVDLSPVVAATLALAGHRKYSSRSYDLLKSVAGPSAGGGEGGWADDDAPGWKDPFGRHRD